jgi:hypothetical protein
MEALWATILFSGFALEVIIRHLNQLKTAWMADLHYCQPRLEVSVI